MKWCLNVDLFHKVKCYPTHLGDAPSLLTCWSNVVQYRMRMKIKILFYFILEYINFIAFGYINWFNGTHSSPFPYQLPKRPIVLLKSLADLPPSICQKSRYACQKKGGNLKCEGLCLLERCELSLGNKVNLFIW